MIQNEGSEMTEPRRVDEVDKFGRDDVIGIVGRRGSHTVLYIDLFDDPGRDDEVTVVGGTGGRRQIRTFRRADVRVIRRASAA